MENTKIVIIFYSSPGYVGDAAPGMSGGGRIFIESIKRWKKKVGGIEVFTCPSGKAMLDYNIDCQEGIVTNVLKTPKIRHAHDTRHRQKKSTELFTF